MFFTVFLLFISSIFSEPSRQCEDLIGNCEYYSCIEEKKHCGHKGYLEAFGLKYCLKFHENEDQFCPYGKEWLEKVRSCLMVSVGEFPENTSCKNFKKMAFQSHVPCYLSTGFCELSMKEKKKIFKMISGTLWRPEVLKSLSKVALACKKE